MSELLNGTVRRALVALLGVALVALSKRLGLELSAEEIAAITTMVVSYLAQSAMKETAQMKADAKAKAAAAIQTPAEVVAELKKADG